jgi:site-specific DNA-methyltransferase (adenine-specific)
MSRKETVNGSTIYLGRMEDILPSLRFDHILTDPPYLYLKKQKLDREFDEALLFETAKRVLTDDGFIALFGRGTSFYRWNTTLADLGFVFREEIVWNKLKTSGIAKHISRVHETVSLHTKKTGTLNSPKIPYEEAKAYNLDVMAGDLRRISNALDKPGGIEKLKTVIAEKKARLEFNTRSRHSVSFAGKRMSKDSSCSRLSMIETGMFEKSIISIGRSHYGTVHGTQKPVRLAERILALISDPGDTVCDPFMGSGSFGVACLNTGRKYIGIETDPGYFETAYKRMKTACGQLFVPEGNHA